MGHTEEYAGARFARIRIGATALARTAGLLVAFAVSVGVRAEAEQAPPKIVFEPPTAERARGSELGVLDDSRVPVVRIVYLVPSDRVPDPEYPSVLVQAAHHFRAWLYQQLGNRTFQLHAPVVETYQTTHPASWYQGDRAFADLYYRAAADGFAAAGGGRYLDPDFIWLFAIDADAACTQCETCGAAGVAVLAAGNLRGLAGRKQPDACGRQPRFDPPCQFTGVLGHSLGQALGMDSADVCQRGDPACWEGEQPPGYGLSELGYVFYPRTWLLDDDVATLNASAFISAQPPPPTFDCALIAPCTPADEQRCAGVCSFDGAAVETGQTGATADMVKNGSFEDCAFSRDGEPQGWRRWARYPSDAGFTWDETRARDGGKSIKISAATPNDQYWSQQVAVTPNRWYRLSAWVRAVNVAHSDEMVDAGANVGLRDTYTFSTPIFGTKGWTQVTLDFNSGDSDEVGIAARLGYSFGGTTGTAWFDGLTLELLPSTPTPSPTPSASPTPTPTDTSTPTPSATEPPTSTPTETETATEVPTSTHTETSTQTPLPSATSAPTQSPTLGPTEVDTETPTETPSRSLEPDATATASENADPSPTPSPVETPTTSPSEPPLETPTDTPPATIKIEPTAVATETVEPSPTASIAELPTVATTAMPTDTPVETPSPTMIAETPTIEIPTPPVEPVATNTMPPTQSPTDATAAPATTTAGPLPTETAVAPTTALPISTATVKPPASPSRTSTRSAFPKATVTPRLEPETCPGDCDGDQNVTSAELVSAVRIALALADPLACAALDRNEDRAVTIDELVGAITAAIDGCAPPSAP